MENTQQPKVTQEYLNALPCRTVMVGGTPKSVRYDENQHIVYLLNDNGTYSGRSAHMELPSQEPAAPPQPAPPEQPAPPAEPPVQGPEPAQESGFEQQAEPLDLEEQEDAEEMEGSDEEDAEETENTPKELPSLLKKIPAKWLICGVAALIVIVLASVIIRAGRIVSQQGEPTTDARPPVTTTAPSTQPTTAPSVPTDTTAPTEKMVSVIVAGRDILPGHVISKNDLAAMEISEADYRLLCATDAVITVDYADKLAGLTASVFLPEGAMVGSSTVTNQYAPVIPWTRSEGQVTVSLPVSLSIDQIDLALWGNRADIKIVVQTKTTAEKPVDPEGETATPDGLHHQSSKVESMVIDTYTIPGTMITDVLNQKGKSLYPFYYALATIPAVYRQQILESYFVSANSFISYIPCYVAITVTPEQAALIQSLDVKNMTVSISNTKPVANTEMQSDTYCSLSALADALTGIAKKLEG